MTVYANVGSYQVMPRHVTAHIFLLPNKQLILSILLDSMLVYFSLYCS